MNGMDMLNAIDNPAQYIMQLGMQQMIRQHPKQWQAAQEMFNGKNRKQSVAELRKLYKSKGMDLEAIAKQYGIQL